MSGDAGPVPGAPAGLPPVLAVAPLDAPPDATVRLPGSKSLTNRALVAAALADGPSTLTGALVADDTEAMVDGLSALGVAVEVDGDRMAVAGRAAGPPPAGATVDCRLSGTTARFLLPVAALAGAPVRLDGAAPLRRRPMGPSIEALRALGATVLEEGEPGHLPVALGGDPPAGGSLTLPGDASSQFLSGLLLAAPAMAGGLEVRLGTSLVSRPYVDMTVAVLEAFGARVVAGDDRWRVGSGGLRGRAYAVEPDASAASYFFAAAAVTGGRVRVEGLGRRSLQGDLGFVDVLARMGAAVEVGDDATEVRGTGTLHGVEVDLADLSDTAQTLAVVAALADSPTRITGIGFIRAKETDRIAATVRELRRCGVDAEEEADGLVVRPGGAGPGRVATYDDHRMAMSFAVLGLRVPGIEIVDPGCVAKTFPGFWASLAELRGR